MRSPRVVEPEKDDACLASSGQSGDFAKVKIESQNHAVLRHCLGKNFAVGRAVQSFIPEVLRIVRLLAKPLRYSHVHSHVGEESHTSLYEICTCSWVSHAAYSIACWMSSRSRSG